MKMSTNPDQENKLDATQMIEIEREQKSLSIARSIEYHKTIHAYAAGGIRALLVLNAGALTILPIYWKLMGIDASQHPKLITYMVGFYFVGLFSALLVIAFSYLMERELQKAEKYSEHTSHIQIHHGFDFDDEHLDLIGKKLYEDHKQHISQSNVYKFVAYFFACTAIVAFLSGSTTSIKFMTFASVNTKVERCDK